MAGRERSRRETARRSRLRKKRHRSLRESNLVVQYNSNIKHVTLIEQLGASRTRTEVRGLGSRVHQQVFRISSASPALGRSRAVTRLPASCREDLHWSWMARRYAVLTTCRRDRPAPKLHMHAHGLLYKHGQKRPRRSCRVRQRVLETHSAATLSCLTWSDLRRLAISGSSDASWISQQRADAEQHLADSERRRPLRIQDVEADAATPVDVAVIDFGGEFHFRRLEGVFAGELDVQYEDSILIRRIFLRTTKEGKVP